MKGRSYGLLILAVAAALSASGCETLKGVKRDVDNTVVNIQNAPENLKAVDAKMRKTLW